MFISVGVCFIVVLGPLRDHWVVVNESSRARVMLHMYYFTFASVGVPTYDRGVSSSIRYSSIVFVRRFLKTDLKRSNRRELKTPFAIVRFLFSTGLIGEVHWN